MDSGVRGKRVEVDDRSMTDDSVDDWRMTGRWPMTLADDRSMTDDSVDDSMTQVDDPMTQVDDSMTQIDDRLMTRWLNRWPGRELFAGFMYICNKELKNSNNFGSRRFRTNQMHHSNRVGEADSFDEKIQKVSIILNNANFSNFLTKRMRLSKPERMVRLVCPKTF